MRRFDRVILFCLAVLSGIGYASDPNFVVFPDFFSSTAFEGGSSPDPNLLTLTNQDGAPVNWLIENAGMPGWLLLSQTSGTLNPGQSESVMLSYDSSGLSIGTYEYQFDVVDLDGRFAAKTITVRLKIIGAVLELSERNFYQSLYQGQANPDPNVIFITNAGVHFLNWSVDTVLPDWLLVDPVSGSIPAGDSEAMTLVYNTSGLSGGHYACQFQVADPMAAHSPQTVTVALNVIGPAFGVSNTNFVFMAEEGSPAPAEQFMTLQNSGGGTIDWTAEMPDKPDWLSVTPTSGTLGRDASETVTIAVDPTGLTGQYDYTFTVFDPALPDTVHQIQVRLLVIDGAWDIFVPEDYSTIQAAIDAAQYGVKIHVAAGTYVENITLKSGISLIGESMETCVIDGNQNGRSVVVAGNCDSNTVVTGFTVTNGSLGGLNTWDSHLQISNCIFSANSTEYDGGGIRCNRSDLQLFDCVFIGNSAGSGGGIGCRAGSLQLTKCSFIDNSAESGGGIYNNMGGGYNSNLIINNCEFKNNNASFMNGGAINSCGGVYITDSTFSENTSFDRGGAINRLDEGGDMVIMNSQFTGNLARSGGGICNYNGNVTASNCIFNGNTASETGGGMYVIQGKVMLINGTFYGNSARYGGAVARFGGAIIGNIPDIKIANCILWGNSSTQWYGYNEVYGGVSIYYSNIAGCGGSGVGWDTSLGVDGGGNIDADPLFIDADGADHVPGTDDDNLRLQFSSPCIDAGDNASVILATMDLDGYDRFVDDLKTTDTGKGTAPIVDMGAYETASCNTIWVNQNYSENGENDGHVWGVDAFKVIQDGLDAAVYGDTVKVAPGFYIEIITLKNGVMLIGSGTNETTIRGCAGAVVTAQYCDPNTLLEGFTIMNGRNIFGIGFGGGMFIHYGDLKVNDCRFIHNSANCGGGLAVFFGKPHISNSTFYGNTSTYGYGYGGGIYNVYGDPVVDSCTFVTNTSYGKGGGICSRHGSITVNNCAFRDNLSRDNGGGIYCLSDFVSLSNCQFVQNAVMAPSGNGRGGGAYIAGMYGNVENCLFYENTAAEDGGGLFLSNEGVSSPDFNVTNCTFIDNFAGSGPSSGQGGGVYGFYCGARFDNCTFSRNSAKNYGGAACFSNGIPVLKNCILWENSAAVYPEIFNWDGSADLTVIYSNVAGSGGSGSGWDASLGTDGGGNIDVDPLFVDADAGDVHLKSQAGRWDTATENWVVDDVTSSCIDAGDPDDSFASEPFPHGGRINMGAYGGTAQASKSYFRNPPCPAPYAGDINGDCTVDLLDFSFIASRWLDDLSSQ